MGRTDRFGQVGGELLGDQRAAAGHLILNLISLCAEEVLHQLRVARRLHSKLRRRDTVLGF